MIRRTFPGISRAARLLSGRGGLRIILPGMRWLVSGVMGLRRRFRSICLRIIFRRRRIGRVVSLPPLTPTLMGESFLKIGQPADI